jgi:hypothetical protein
VVSLEDYLMAEPENHTLRLLREIRSAIGALDNKVDDKITALDNKIDRNQEELQKRIDSPAKPCWAKAFSAVMPPPNSTSDCPPSNSVFLRSKADGDLPAVTSQAPQLSATLTDDSGNS